MENTQLTTETLSLMTLGALPGVGLKTLRTILIRYDSAMAALEALAQGADVCACSAEDLAEARRWAEAEMAYCEAHAVRILTLTDADYPARLRACADAPPYLFYRGAARLNAKYVVAIVGTRNITEYGKDLCRHLCQDLADFSPDVLVLSGLAYGVDIHAHRQALEANLPTVGVLAHGLDRLYPSAHRTTAIAMLNKGGLLTEYPRLTVPDKGRFLQRNRIVAGMADVVVVVESGIRGGALATARLARQYERPVYAFPGRANDEMSAGCNALLRDGRAKLITSAQDLLADWLGASMRGQGEATAPDLFAGLGADEERLVAVLRQHDARTLDQLAAATGMDHSLAASLLFDLNMRELVKTLPGGAYRLVR